ncbi:capsular biosynthesis protein [Altererythrobacter aerius]|uniref:Capsular biosynthesis protein n=1 Tax=Tsuneonella aeria TaxID=1837929 RepID=A0A6I4TBW9_9SPHN|nr:capsular biosynthesis protein [Tsuneonella aeria]MXO74157.1 capsular biosynthesis protein [Tsuneonella aeria]
MTDHSAHPLPPSSDNTDEDSLFERASAAFGLDAMRLAPVPQELASEPVRLVRDPKRRASPEEHARIAGETEAPPPEPSVSLEGVRHAIDRERLRRQGLIVPEAEPTALLEEFRIIKRQLIAAARDNADPAARRILVCSPLPGDGKTFCATNLAIAMAGERDGEVVLVDADFAKPSIPDALGLPRGPGLMDALANPELNVEDVVLATDIPGLFVLPAGQQIASDSEWLASARTAEVLARLSRGAPGRMIVFDSPPVLAASIAADLARHVGQAVLVARADSTAQSALEDSVQLLGACPDIKLLLNATRFSPSGRRFGTYYGFDG